MAHTATDSAQPRRASLNKFIVALFLVKSKPASTTIGAYLAKLKSLIREGRRPGTLDSGERYIDSVNFWKSSYDKSEQTQRSLRVKVEELEQRLQTPTQATLETSSQLRPPKRKRDGTDVAGSDGQSRASKIAKSIKHGTIIKYQRLGLDEIACDLGTSEDTQLHSVLEGVYLLQQAASQRTPRENIQSLLIQLLLDMGSLITGVQTDLYGPTSIHLKARTKTTRTQERTLAYQQAALEAEAEGKLTAVARLFHMAMDVLCKLSQMPQGRSLQGQVIYHTVLLFQRLLEQISTMCAAQGKLSRVATPRRRKTQGRIEKQIKDYLAPPKCTRAGDTVDNGGIIKLLKQLAMTIMSTLDPSKATEREILEGITFLILSHSGRLLGEFVFAGEEENIDPYLEYVNDEGSAVQDAQAPHLVHLLRHAMGLKAKEPRSATATGRIGSYPRTLRLQSTQSNHNDISVEAKTELQNTLLKGVFGDNASGLGEGLQNPLSGDVEVPVRDSRKERSVNMKRWYIGEVWKLVGWDVLREVIQREE